MGNYLMPRVIRNFKGIPGLVKKWPFWGMEATSTVTLIDKIGEIGN